MNSIYNISCSNRPAACLNQDRLQSRNGMWLAALLFLLLIPAIVSGQSTLPDECELTDGLVICIFDADDTFTVPDGVTEITVEAWGAGGGGGNLTNQGQGGGGGGAYARSTLSVSSGTEFSISVGTGGEPGQPGGDTYFDSILPMIPQIVMAQGGLGAIDDNGGIGGSALTSVGDVVFSGGAGGDGQKGGGQPDTRGGGGGGGSAFTDADGENGTIGGSNTAGTGGSGTGDGGDGAVGEQDAQPGMFPGGGGGGAGPNGISGAGADGRLIITYEAQITTIYSRASGDWSDPATWTFDASHSGTAAFRTPNIEDTVKIANNDFVSLSEDVVNHAEVSVMESAGLATGEFVLSGDGIFSLEQDAVLQIGSSGGISISDASGNIQMETRNFSPDAHYVYNGHSTQFTGDGLPSTVKNLTIDNGAGVISEGGISRSVTGTLNLSDGVFTMAPGASLVTRTNGVDATGGGAIRMQQVIDGGEGYRMISSPAASSYSDLLDGFVTQGLPGSNWPDRQPNLLYFLETYADSGTTANQSWRTISNLTDNTNDGRGYFFYVFGDIPEDNDYSDPLPKTMSVAGLEPGFSGAGGTFEFDVSYTPTRENTAYLEGWNLAGNPTTATLDWDSNAWSRTNIDETIYVWDPVANGGAGDYLVWNGVEGTLPDEGLIAPFQSFWVKANDEGPSMAITDQVKTTGGTFVNDPSLSASMAMEKPLALGMSLHTGDLKGDIFLTFMDEGKLGSDRYDAYRLEPLSGVTYLTFFTSDGRPEDAPLQINNLPRDLDQKIIIPLQVGGKKDGKPISGDFTLEWDIPSGWPQDWAITLMDHKAEKGISMQNQDYYTFWHESPGNQMLRASAKPSSDKSKLNMPVQLMNEAGIVSPEARPARMTSNARESRFTVVIDPGGDPNSAEYIPNEVKLRQNYPNPFNSSTNIRMTLPQTSDVVLEVYDMIGRRVATLANGSFPGGNHTFTWDASNVASGMYIYRLSAGQSVQSKKMMLIK